MRDINEPLRVAYATQLLQVPSVPVYYQALPNNLNPDNYIVFRSINNNDASTLSIGSSMMIVSRVNPSLRGIAALATLSTSQ